MTSTAAIRITITILAALQAGIAALLAFGDVLPQWGKIACVVASAMIGVLLNQVPSWSSAPQAAAALRAGAPD